MEIRIVVEDESKILIRRPITLTEMKATVRGPAIAKVSTPIPVEWTGPAGEGDFITVAKKGADDASYLNYFYIFNMPPTIELMMPDEAGDYELRYTTQDNKVLVRQRLLVK